MLVLPVTETTGKGLTVNCEMVVAWQLPIEFLYAKMCVPADNFEASSTPLTLMADDGPERAVALLFYRKVYLWSLPVPRCP